MMQVKAARFGLFVILAAAGSALAAPGTPRIQSDLERLGMRLYKDEGLSFNGLQSCQSCHNPQSGFADRRNAMNPSTQVVSIGADGFSQGTRNAPTAAYAGFSPPLSLVGGEWFGGLFWDGRASGYTLLDPLAEQAEGPPLNPVEMAMPDKASVVAAVQASAYLALWQRVFGAASLQDVDQAYDLFAVAVAAYERSRDVTRFTSAFDIHPGELSDQQLAGFDLVEIHCVGCHDSRAVANASGPLWTTFGYANIGLPSNPLVQLDSPDLGLGAVVGDQKQDGKFKIPTLRNVSKTAPYGHNGVIAELRDMVAFISDRGGSAPEVSRNLSTLTGSLGLSDPEIDSIVSFLEALADDV